MGNKLVKRAGPALLAGASALAFAWTASSARDGDQGEVERIVVTGSATPVETYKLGSSLTVIPGELIEDQGYSYVPDALRQVPGVAVNRTGPYGAPTQARIRGGEGNHTLVLLDGIDVSSPDQGETDFSTLLSGDIERIEVLRGPQSGLYGSNALAGVVNLITRRDIDGSYVNLSAEAGELGSYQLQANGGLGDGDSYASAGVHALTTDGYDVSPDTRAAGVPFVGEGGEAGDDEGNEVVTAYIRGGAALTSALRLDAIARYLDKTSEVDGQAFSPPIAGLTYDDAGESDQTQLLAGASATLSLFDDRWRTVGSASYVDEERRSVGTFFDPANLAVPLEPFGADATRTTFALQSTVELGAPGFVSRLTGFVEDEETTFQNAFPVTPDQALEQTRDLLGVGVEYRADIAEQLYLSAALRHDDNSGFDDADTYSLAASWVIPNSGSRLHGSFGTGVTDPTFIEQFGFDPGAFTPNPDLVPEEAEGWELGLEQTLFDGRAVLDVTYFESTLQNEIFTDFSVFPFTAANATEESERSGWEASLRLNLFDGLDVVGSYTNLDATEPAGIEERRPEHQAALDAVWAVNGGPLQLNLGLTYNGEQADTDFGTFVREEMDAYTLVRFGARYQVADRVEVYGRAENAFDEEYEEVIGYRGSPRAVFVGVRFSG